MRADLATDAPRGGPAPPDPEVRRVAAAPARLVVRLPTWLGDVVMAAPALEALSRALPETTLVAAARPGQAGLAAMLPSVAAVLEIGDERGPGGVRAAARRYREDGADAVLALPRGARALLAPYLARVPVRVGFGAPLQRWLLTHPVEGWRAWRGAHRSAWLGLPGRAFGAGPLGAPVLCPPTVARERARQLLGALGHRPGRPLVLLEPGAAYGPAKCWPADRFGRLARLLLDDGADVATIGHRRASAEDEIVRLAPGVLRAAGRTPELPVLAALLEAASLVVTNDTGPMHLAAAVGAPVLALFGATDPVVSGPAGAAPRRILVSPTPCSPCFLRRCAVPGHPCLASIGVGRVHREAREMLCRVRI